jgi:parvulin-like peptidyl-prolyl isomerase
MKTDNYFNVKNHFVVILLSCFVSCHSQPVPGRTETAAKTLIDSLYTALVKGSDFAKLAKEYSDDPGSKNSGGIYENVAEGSFVAEFEEAVGKLQPQQISPPFETEYGYHIAQLLSRKDNHFTVRHILVRVKR